MEGIAFSHGGAFVYVGNPIGIGHHFFDFGIAKSSLGVHKHSRVINRVDCLWIAHIGAQVVIPQLNGNASS
jgi:hypothetical protein